MSTDDEIPGLGMPGERLRHNPAVELHRLPLSNEEYFVWTRVDGQTTIHDVILMVGLPRSKTIGILRRLREMGALLREGEQPRPVPAPAATAAPAAPGAAAPRKPAPPRPAARAASPPAGPDEGPSDDDALAALGALTDEERAALDEEVELTRKQRLRVLAMRRQLDADHFAVLGVSADTDKRALRRAYFQLSKEFHPDRYYGKHTGSFGPWLARVFERITEAHEVLSDSRRREEYQRRQSGEHPRGSQTRAEHAAELFERACASQAGGRAGEALKLFAAIVRMDEQPRYLSRAARCAIDAGETATAAGYAERAAALDPDNPSIRRVLASAQEAAGDLSAARDTLEAALALKSENDALATGLRADLDRVRARLARRPGH